MAQEFTDFHLFCGSGGAALGFQDAREEYRGLVGRFRTLAGVDVDPKACEDFRRLTGAPAVEMDLFSREGYEAFHGHRPPTGWRETAAEDLRVATGGECPDAVFLSPPCKGFSGLLPADKAASEKYQALNRLVVRGLALTMEAFADNLPAVILLENVPRITSRGEWLLRQVKKLLASHGYVFHGGYHDCGELGGLAQHRRRYLLIARNREKMAAFVYRPPVQRVRSIGEVLGELPMPDDSIAGPMHRLPRLQWKTWVRLALIPAGGDWRDLQTTGGKYCVAHTPRKGVYRVAPWDEPASTVIGSASVRGSNGVAAVADPRLPGRKNRRSNSYIVRPWEGTAFTVTGEDSLGSGGQSVADPRIPFNNVFRVTSWGETAGAVTGGRGSTGTCVADPRLSCTPRNGTLGVQAWYEPAATVTGAGDIHAGAAAVADPRIPADNDRLDPPPVIISLDGTWHRPLTTLELAALQGFPVVMPDGSPLILAGKLDAAWRERIGNAVPPPAARAIAEQILLALMASQRNEWALGSTGIWVVPRWPGENRNLNLSNKEVKIQ